MGNNFAGHDNINGKIRVKDREGLRKRSGDPSRAAQLSLTGFFNRRRW
jgi:hypothetical protein